MVIERIVETRVISGVRDLPAPTPLLTETLEEEESAGISERVVLRVGL
jgi:hypothetical protein